ncbi:MAG TPA: hypothetical protein VN611_18345 [Patescibacteria group bacterium]|nr:hypothetical protein [Patescibacteria group bacterium]
MPLSVHSRIAALLPCYTSQGDSCQVLSSDGLCHVIPCRVPAVLRRLARSRALDLTELRRQTGGLTCRRLLQPLPLAPGLVLVPFKVRQPRVPGDPAIGYVNLHAISEINAKVSAPYRSIVQLVSGRQIPCFWNTATIHRLLAMARLTAPETATPLRENAAGYASADPLAPLARRLAEVFYDILLFKQQSDVVSSSARKN